MSLLDIGWPINTVIELIVDDWYQSPIRVNPSAVDQIVTFFMNDIVIEWFESLSSSWLFIIITIEHKSSYNLAISTQSHQEKVKINPNLIWTRLNNEINLKLVKMILKVCHCT